MDENYYDLDDDFIDDGDLEMQEEDNDNYLYNDADTSKFQSERNEDHSDRESET